MPPVDMYIDAPPERVWQELAKAETYEHWVVGSRTIESSDPGFPAPGTRFEHTQGKAPLVIRDDTEVIAADPPHRIELLAKARPVLVAHVIVELHPAGRGADVTMEELPVSGPLALLLRTPPGAALTKARNKEALRRLKERAESG